MDYAWRVRFLTRSGVLLAWRKEPHIYKSSRKFPLTGLIVRYMAATVAITRTAFMVSLSGITGVIQDVTKPIYIARNVHARIRKWQDGR